MEDDKLFKVSCLCIVKAKDIERVKEWARFEFGEAYEPHIMIDEVSYSDYDEKEIDYNL